MEWFRRAACLWPGLPQLWQRGSWKSLLLAVGFGAVLNLAVVTTFVWPEWMASSIRWMLWIAALGAWTGAALATAMGWDNPTATPDGNDASDDLYCMALTEYLRGNLVEAENYLQTLIRRNSADCEARLQLATLWRHTGRVDEAREMLWRLQRFDASTKWEPEIAYEHQRLEQVDQAGGGHRPGPSDTDSAELAA